MKRSNLIFASSAVVEIANVAHYKADVACSFCYYWWMEIWYYAFINCSWSGLEQRRNSKLCQIFRDHSLFFLGSFFACYHSFCYEILHRLTLSLKFWELKDVETPENTQKWDIYIYIHIWHHIVTLTQQKTGNAVKWLKRAWIQTIGDLNKNFWVLFAKGELEAFETIPKI